MSEETVDLHRKYRPDSIEEVIGQPDAVRVIKGWFKAGTIPHALMFTGPSGTGKTTTARVIANFLGINQHDLEEVNCADSRGIEVARDIRQRMGLAAIGGSYRMWILDEVHRATGDCQSSLLKMVEEPPPHAYFVFCTTDPQKVLTTLVNRCCEVKLKRITDKKIEDLVKSVAEREGIELTDEVLDAIVESSDGSARKSLVILQSVAAVEDPEERLTCVHRSDSKQSAIELARLLIKPGVKWAEVCKVLKGLDDEPETLRYMVLSYANKIALGDSKLVPRALNVLTAFSNNFYDSKKAGLTLACAEVVLSK
jgi:DNA polymerase III gamma/tau subunit